MDDHLTPIDVKLSQLVAQQREQLEEALSALELMVEQYLWHPNSDGHYQHDFMCAGEHACTVLAALRPECWEATPIGIQRKGES